MARGIGEFTRTIRFRLLASLFLLLGLSILISLAGILSHERRRYVEAAQEEGMRVTLTVEHLLRQAMLENDWEAIRRTVAGVHQIVQPSNIGILSSNGTLLVSGNPRSESPRFSADHNPECVTCHQLAGAKPTHKSVLMEVGGEPVLRNVVKIANGQECHACHDPGEKILGIMFYDVPFAKTFAMLRTVMFRTLLAGLVTFLLVATVLSLIIQRYLYRPLQQLETGFMRAGRGDFSHWVEVEAEGEIQDMAVQFNVMSQAIKRAMAEIKRKNWETEHLYSFVRDLNRENEWSKLCRVIIDLLQKTFKAKRVALLLRREKQESAITEICWRENGDRRYQHQQYQVPPPDDQLPTWVAQARDYWHNIPEGGTAFTQDNTTAMANLATHQVSLGLICLHRREGEAFNKMEKKLLAAVSEQIEITLANARLYRMAITDGLTGLYSKRYCETKIRELLDGHTLEQHRAFSVLMLDLDHFKRVNDTHGHQVGDEVLAQLAAVIRSHIRRDDVACRYGGEEFIILVPGEPGAAVEVAERLCRSVEKHTFVCQGGLKLQNTVSIGIASFPRHGRTAGEVIGAADEALYGAKNAGRNRCMVNI